MEFLGGNVWGGRAVRDEVYVSGRGGESGCCIVAKGKRRPRVLQMTGLACLSRLRWQEGCACAEGDVSGGEW